MKNPETGEYYYKDLPGSTYTVPVEFIDFDLYESYKDLTLSGFGVSKLSDIFLIPSIVLAGDIF